ncbi:hypothetical protein [Halocalculus aciditolerans]|uniref:Metal-dependent hydrolase n=1 Tax=Halocalculus aciditolerans TaxID=1383812 RepID=A0A830FC33_9EURY|nr:hypothetical protein [Halocalculus aciditolerans]GGL60479.1 hypothetical protein GCM10009039_18410 [Halocalculus aciditolerans]
MYSRDHAVVSAAVGVPLAVAAPAHPLFVWAWAVALGVGIDVDHFLVARLNRGDWRNARRVLRDPTLIVRDPASIFGRGDLWRDQRLLSHHLLGGVLVALCWAVDAYWAVATAVTLYAHVLADLYADMRTRDDYLRGEP